MSTADPKRPADEPRTAGVQELIDRLRADGIAKGKDEAEALVVAARAEATRLLDDAKREAAEVEAAARAAADRLRANAEDALRLAARDAVIALREALTTDFATKLRRLVSHTLEDRSFLERLILTIASQAVPEDALAVEVQLPADLVTQEELQASPASLADDALARFVLDLSSEILREGLSFAPGEDERPGLRVKLQDDDIEIDLTDEAVTALLMDHLGPRFRALMNRPAH
ncbi:MAG: hypothetical protein KF688_14895 [Pirellulales bacterium]|nr:hypothetical protein [Pirellulales bacterium]MBX3435678.1 hypothetical protein [Pirellulales bacterium]